MGAASGERRFDRGSALAGFGALVGAYLLGLPGLASAANRVPVWRLDAVHSAGAGAYRAGCTGCTACRNHALNRIFATKAAAVGGRAHAGCSCSVVRSSLAEADFIAIFGSVAKPTRTTYDRRWGNAGKLVKEQPAAIAKAPKSQVAEKRAKAPIAQKKQSRIVISKHAKKKKVR